MPFWFCFYPRPPSLLLRLFFSIKRKSRTSCQLIALALGHSVLVDRKNFRELDAVKIVQIAEDDHENFGEARRGSLEGLLVCQHLCDEMVVAARVDEEPWKPARLFRSGCRGRTWKIQSLLLKKGRLSSEKVDTWPQGKTFAGLLCNQARAKIKLTKNKK